MRSSISSKLKLALCISALLIMSVPALLVHYHTATYGPSYPPDTFLLKTREELFKIIDAMNPSASTLWIDAPEDIREFDVALSGENHDCIDEAIALEGGADKDAYQPAEQFISSGDNNLPKARRRKLDSRGKSLSPAGLLTDRKRAHCMGRSRHPSIGNS